MSANQKANRSSVSTEKFHRKAKRMSFDFREIIKNGRREDYKYSEAHRNHMRDILKNPATFSQDDKINTLLSFHKDTCANVILQLYPSFGDDILPKEAFEDLKILEEFETVLVGLDKMKTEMSDFLKSPDALPEDIKNWMLQNLQSDDDDDKHLQGVKRGKRNALAKLQRLGVDISQYDDSDQYPKFVNDLPTQATIDQYILLEKDVTRTSDKMVQLLEDVPPILVYLDDVRRHTEIMKRELYV
ncbi:hypothetical protein MKW92_010249 [Papaver armeniacum]|nr:hypothetical protein MKW92_010249 [Papaver armeniacum]